ncbi:uncharacterized protein [Dysidea avara]|uniref:uncharacterized protein isoform X2 n=1 Tax=Dysidea avara TaxID=196820 RepID=UPI003329E714
MMIKTLYLLLIVSNVIAALSQHQSFPSTIDVSESCEAAIRRLSTLEVTEPTLMAQYWDSWGKPNHGMMYGHTVFLGYYDECIDLKNTAVGETKYCIYAMEMNSTTLLDSKDDICHSEDCPKPLNFNASTSIEIGVCYPSACSPNEFATVLSRMDISSTTSVTVDPFNNVLDTHITKLTSTSDVPSFCPQTDPEYDGGTVAVIVVLAVLCSRNDAECHRRQLYIRTYSVVPLNEKCGLLEWVHNTNGLRQILNKIYQQRGMYTTGKELKEIAKAVEKDPEIARDVFLNQLLPKFPVVFDEWFLHNFLDPTAWYQARVAYIRTCAVMSIVGYILGLGDRHGENILFDSTNGDCVHVDFNCLFNRGEQLGVPERVPFRLTHNMVHAMG